MSVQEAREQFEHDLGNWQRAYPTDVFGEDLTSMEASQIANALSIAGFSSDRVHASWARHVVACISEHYEPLRVALEQEDAT